MQSLGFIFFELVSPLSVIKVQDWRRDWWKTPFLLLLWLLLTTCQIICISIAYSGMAVEYLVQSPGVVREYVHRKTHPLPPETFRRRSARGDFPQRLQGRARALTLELPSDEVVKGGVQLKAEQDGKRAYQTSHQQTEGQQQKHGNSHEPKQKEQQRTYLQHRSILFRKIPPEVRRLIYRAVLLPPERTELRIARTRGRLCSYTYSQYMGDLSSVSNDEPQNKKNCKRNRSAGLLCSCRQVYMEAMDVLYQETPFNISHSTILQDLHETTVPHRFRSIRSLHLDIESFYPSTSICVADGENTTWNMAWLTIGWMTGLRRLRVTLWQPTDDGLLGVLRPMLNFNIPDFVVRLTWPVDSTQLIRQLGGEVPFRIVAKEVI